MVAVLFAAGCGGGGSGGSQTSSRATQPARVVLRDVSKAVEDASSFRMSGRISGVGDSLGPSGKPVGIDFTIARDKGVSGSLTVAGGKVDLIVTGKNAYLRASSEFWKQVIKQKGGGPGAGLAATLFGDKWLKIPAGNNGLGPLTNPAKFGSLFKSLTSNFGTVENKGEKTYKGQSVVVIESSKSGTLYVSATGTPYPVAIVKTGGKTNGAVTFDSWNKAVTLTPPKGALDLSQFGG
jgi:hypothetical protein